VLVTEIVRSRVHTSHCQNRQPVTADWKVSCPIQESAGASTAEEGRARQFTASELQADLKSADRVQSPGETRVSTPVAPPAQLSQLQPVPVGIQKGTFHRDCTTGGPGWSLYGGRRQAGHS